ncbi:hypothetical protein STEG23_015541, partial [Scotinomys teguina]
MMGVRTTLHCTARLHGRRSWQLKYEPEDRLQSEQDSEGDILRGAQTHEVDSVGGSDLSTLLTLAEWSRHFTRQGEAVAYYLKEVLLSDTVLRTYVYCFMKSSDPPYELYTIIIPGYK